MKKHTKTLGVVSWIALVASSHAAITVGDTIGIDFGNTATSAGDNFNVIGGTFDTDVALNRYSDNAATGVTIHISGPGAAGGYNNSDPSAGTAGETVPFMDAHMQDWMGIFGGTGTRNTLLLFKGLDDSLTYDITAVIGQWSTNTAFDGMSIFVTGQDSDAFGTVSASGEPVYTNLTGLTSSGGNLTVQLSSPSNNQALSALTLTAVPEPSSTALLGLGGLALVLRRRR
ncbi:MAG: PEP-CTERM sorting domain-containing protein [Akkermansiaceae bacterium]